MRINFHFDEDRYAEMTADAWIALEDYSNGQQASMRGSVDLMATFMQNDAGEWLTEGEAHAILGRMKLEERSKTFVKFAEAFNEYLVPKASGNSSTSSTTEPVAPVGSPI